MAVNDSTQGTFGSTSSYALSMHFAEALHRQYETFAELLDCCCVDEHMPASEDQMVI